MCARVLCAALTTLSFPRQVTTALQVCHSLGSLQPTVDTLLDDTRRRLHTRLTDSLRLEALMAASAGSPGSRPGAAALPSNTVTFRAALWNSLEKLADHIYGACAQIQHIHKVGRAGMAARVGRTLGTAAVTNGRRAGDAAGSSVVSASALVVADRRCVSCLADSPLSVPC